MTKRTLLEEIRRIHEISGIKSEILVEGLINEAADPITKEMARIIASFFTGMEKEIIVAGKKITQKKAEQIVSKIGSKTLTADEVAVVKTLTKEVISADAAIIGKLTSDIFGEMQKLTSRTAKTKYFSEVKAALKGILPDEEVKNVVSGVNSKVKAGTTTTSSSTSSGTGGKTSTGGKSTEFTIPDLDTNIPDVWKMGREETKAALKNRFPQAPSSDIAKMTNNLEKMKITDQAVFDRELKAAVQGYLPKYQKILDNPGNYAKFKASYESWPKVAKWVFWLTTSTVSYATLKQAGVPIDKWSNYIASKLKEIFKDQAGGAIDGLTGNTTTSTTTTTTPPTPPTDNVVDDSEKGLRNYFATQVNGYDRASADALQIKPLGSSRYEITKDGTKTVLIYSNGKFKRE